MKLCKDISATNIHKLSLKKSSEIDAKRAMVRELFLCCKYPVKSIRNEREAESRFSGFRYGKQ